MKIKNSLNYIHEFLNEEDDFSLVEHILDDIHDSKRLNNGKDKHIVYYLQLSEDEKTGEYNFWVNNIRNYSHLYVYAMLVNWHEQWTEDTTLKNKLDSFQTNFSNEIADEINSCKGTGDIPEVILNEMSFIADYFHWKSKKEVPQFNEKQKQELLSNTYKYERYINLLNSDSSDIITETFIKVLRFCIVIDQTFEDTRCLTSTIKKIYGKEDDMSFDTMLENISLDNSEAKAIRKFVQEGNMKIPAGLIKLAIYSKVTPTSLENANNTEELGQEEFAKATLNYSREDIEILKKNFDSLEAVEQLRLASCIRDNVINNHIISDVCNCTNQVADMRKQILEEIREMQNSVISTLKKNFIPNTANNRVVNDFTYAKQLLKQLLEEEILDWHSFEIAKPDDASMIKGLKKHIKTCNSIIDRCNNDNYVILLMGEYQTGKTTTLDALCGGKNVGSIGDGTKTSAVPLTISFSKEEKVNIVWKELDEFDELFSNIKLYFPSFDLNRINDISFRAKALQEIDALRLNKDFVAPNDWQYLPLWSIVLEFWEIYEEKKSLGNHNNKQLTLEMVSKITRFPKNFLERWEKNGVSNFDDIEAAFIFIKEINCTCSSDALQKLNGTVMDCPGLFASAYDTMVTENAMNTADAILYILPREKQSGEQVVSSLYKIKKEYPDYHRKLLVSNNLSFNNPNTPSIFSANSAMARNMFGDDFKVTPYDALLAYLGYIKESYDSSMLDDCSIKSFIDNTRPMMFSINSINGFNNFEDAWNERMSLYPNGLKMSPSTAIDKSGFQELVNTTKQFVEHNKAYSIIFEKGIDEVKSELTHAIEDIHIQYIEPYLTNDKDLIDLWNNRIEISKLFETKAEDFLRSKFFKAKTDTKKSLSDRLASSVYEKLFNEEIYTEFINNLCDRFYSEAKEIKERKDDESALKQYTTGIVSRCLMQIIKGRFAYWNDTMKSNQDTSFTTIFLPELEAIECQLDSLWKQLYEKDKAFCGSMANYFQLGRDFSSFKMDSKEQEGNAIVDQDSISSLITVDNIAIGAAVTGWAAGFIGGLFIVGGPAGLLVYLLVMVATWFGSSKISEWNERRFKKKIAPKLREQIDNSDLKSIIKNMIFKEVYRLLESYLSNSKLDIKKMERNRDIALSSKKSGASESNCFKAVGLIKRVENQIEKYDTYVSQIME